MVSKIIGSYEYASFGMFGYDNFSGLFTVFGDGWLGYTRWYIAT